MKQSRDLKLFTTTVSWLKCDPNLPSPFPHLPYATSRILLSACWGSLIQLTSTTFLLGLVLVVSQFPHLAQLADTKVFVLIEVSSSDGNGSFDWPLPTLSMWNYLGDLQHGLSEHMAITHQSTGLPGSAFWRYFHALSSHFPTFYIEIVY